MVSLPPLNRLSDAVSVVPVNASVVVAERCQDLLQLAHKVSSGARAEPVDELFSLVIAAFFADAVLQAGFGQRRLSQHFPVAPAVLQMVDGLQPRNSVDFKAVSPLRFTYGFPCCVAVFAVLRSGDAVLIQQILQLFNFFPAAAGQNRTLKIVLFTVFLAADLAGSLLLSCGVVSGKYGDLPFSPAVRQHVGVNRLRCPAVVADLRCHAVGGTGGFQLCFQVLPVVRMCGRVSVIPCRGLLGIVIRHNIGISRIRVRVWIIGAAGCRETGRYQ